MPLEALLSLTAASETTKISRRFWEKAVEERRIPYLQPGGAGGKIYLRPSDIEAFLEKSRHDKIGAA